MYFKGLRGAIAFSLALSLDSRFIPNTQLFITASLFIILFTVFFLGITTKPIIKLLDVKLLDEEQDCGMFIAIQERIFDTIMSGVAEISDVRSAHSFTLKFHRINENVLKRFFTRGDMHSFEHTLEAVKDKTVRRSTRVAKSKPSKESVITVDHEPDPVVYHKKPAESCASADDSVFEEVSLRTGPEVKFRDRSRTGTSESHRQSAESLRRTHLRHTMHEGRRAARGTRVVKQMFHQSQYYHLPLRDSIVTPRSPLTADPSVSKRESAFKFPSRENSRSDQV